MKITRDVVLDLWPAYQANEVSAETRALVDEYLASDTDFASVLKKFGDTRRLLQEPPPTPAVIEERRTVERARSRVLAQWIMLAAAVLVSCLVCLALLGGALLVFPNVGIVGTGGGLAILGGGGLVLVALTASLWWAFAKLARD